MICTLPSEPLVGAKAGIPARSALLESNGRGKGVKVEGNLFWRGSCLCAWLSAWLGAQARVAAGLKPLRESKRRGLKEEKENQKRGFGKNF